MTTPAPSLAELIGALLLSIATLSMSGCVVFAEEPEECRTDGDCGPGCVCRDNRCVPHVAPDPPPANPGPDDNDSDRSSDTPPVRSECHEDTDCADEWLCEAGVCEPGERFCSDDADCRAGELCTDWVCRAACTRDSQCTEGEVCEAGRCEVPEGLCADIWDCPPEQVCIDGWCEAAESTCTSNWDCGPGCVCTNDACVPEIPCELADDCPDGFDCSSDGACYHPADAPGPAQCVADFECPAGLRCEGDGHCSDETGAIPCTASADCPDGGVCIETRCQPPSELDCLTGLDCLEGEVCVDGACVEQPDVDPGVGEETGSTGGGDGLCQPGVACDGIDYCYDTCFTADCCTVVCTCDDVDQRLYCNLYCSP